MAAPLIWVPHPAKLILRAFKLNPTAWWRPADLQNAVFAYGANWTRGRITDPNAKKLVRNGLRWLIEHRCVAVSPLTGRFRTYRLALDPAKVGELEFTLGGVLLEEFNTAQRNGLLELETLNGGAYTVTVYRDPAKPGAAPLRAPLAGKDRRMIHEFLRRSPDSAISLLMAVFDEMGKCPGARGLRAAFAYKKIELAHIKTYATLLRRTSASLTSATA